MFLRNEIFPEKELRLDREKKEIYTITISIFLTKDFARGEIMDINEAVAVNVRRVRRSKGYSLEKAAGLCAVSKSMMGQIERGEVNPTVSVMWKIAAGLETPLEQLLAIPEPAVELSPSTGSNPRREDGGKVLIFPEFPLDGTEGLGLYRVRLLVSGCYPMPAHAPGTVAFLTVYSGTLLLEVDGAEYRMTRGDAIRFRTDLPCCLKNPEIQTAEMSLVLWRGSRGI